MQIEYQLFRSGNGWRIQRVVHEPDGTARITPIRNSYATRSAARTTAELLAGREATVRVIA